MPKQYEYGYNPNDELCRKCAFKSCLLKSKGRDILRARALEIHRLESEDLLTHEKEKPAGRPRAGIVI